MSTICDIDEALRESPINYERDLDASVVKWLENLSEDAERKKHSHEFLIFSDLSARNSLDLISEELKYIFILIFNLSF